MLFILGISCMLISRNYKISRLDKEQKQAAERERVKQIKTANSKNYGRVLSSLKEQSKQMKRILMPNMSDQMNWTRREITATGQQIAKKLKTKLIATGKQMTKMQTTEEIMRTQLTR